MSKENTLGRLLVSAGLLLSGCGPIEKGTRGPIATPTTPPTEVPQPTNLPELPPTSWPTSTPIPIKISTPTLLPPPTATLKPTPLPTETLEPSHVQTDLENLRLVEAGRKKDLLVLNNPLITYLVKLPRPGFPDAVFGVLETQGFEGETGFLAVVENFDCQFESLAESGQLGSQLKPVGEFNSGLWKPYVRLESLETVVLVESSTGTISVLTSKSFIPKEGQEAVVCPKESIFEGFGDLPELVAIETGKLIKEIIEGLEEGFGP